MISAEDSKIKVKSTASPPSDTQSENSDKDLVNPYPFLMEMIPMVIPIINQNHQLVKNQNQL